jgi:hypothetical protein
MRDSDWVITIKDITNNTLICNPQYHPISFEDIILSDCLLFVENSVTDDGFYVMPAV